MPEPPAHRKINTTSPAFLLEGVWAEHPQKLQNCLFFFFSLSLSILFYFSGATGNDRIFSSCRETDAGVWSGQEHRTQSHSTFTLGLMWMAQSSRQNATILVLYRGRRDTTGNQYAPPIFVTAQRALQLIKRDWWNKVGENVTILWVRNTCCIWFKIKTEAVMIKSLYQQFSNACSCLHDKIIWMDVFCSDVALV